MTEAEKTALVRRFSGQVTRLVYSLESGLDIIINVPLTPDIVDAVNSIAGKQGLSGPAWIAMTIDNALQQQSAAQRQYGFGNRAQLGGCVPVVRRDANRSVNTGPRTDVANTSTSTTLSIRSSSSR